MADFDIRAYALIGARVRLEEINREAAAIRSAFPDLGDSALPRARTAKKSGKRGGWTMSAAQKRAVSARMKKYWKARREAKG